MKHNLKLYANAGTSKYLFILDDSKGYYTSLNLDEALRLASGWWTAKGKYISARVKEATLIYETDSFDLEDTETTYNEIQLTLLLEN